jgi:hypothetical protein
MLSKVVIANYEMLVEMLEYDQLPLLMLLIS